MIQWFPSFFALVCSAKASDPDEASERQNDPSCAWQVHTLEAVATDRTHLRLSEKRQILLLLFLGTVFADDSVDKGVVDVAHDGDRWVNLRKFLYGQDGRGERSFGTTKFGWYFDSH